MNGTRAVVSYDDITPPYPSLESSSQNQQPPKKSKWNGAKRKQNQNWSRSQETQQALAQHDHVGSSNSPQDDEGSENGEYEEESRDLTHEEIWDDSALIEAWNAASEEYEAFHGSEKNWKSEPVHKSPLWYNVPPQKSSQPPQKKRKVEAEAVQEPSNQNGDFKGNSDSQPINFDTFVPTHDPSLQTPSSVHAHESGNIFSAPTIPSLSTATPDASAHLQELLSGNQPVSQDEAFSRALGAMYWGGYWTAVYHCQRSMKQQTLETNSASAPALDNEEEGEYSDDSMEETREGGEESQFISTQR